MVKTHPTVPESARDQTARQSYGRRQGWAGGRWMGMRVDPLPTPCGF